MNQQVYADILRSGNRIYKTKLFQFGTLEQRRENMQNTHIGRPIAQKLLILEALFYSKV